LGVFYVSAGLNSVEIREPWQMANVGLISKNIAFKNCEHKTYRAS